MKQEFREYGWMDSTQSLIYKELCYYLSCNSISQIGAKLSLKNPHKEIKDALETKGGQQWLQAIIRLSKENQSYIVALENAISDTKNKINLCLDQVISFNSELNSLRSSLLDSQNKIAANDMANTKSSCNIGLVKE